MITSLAAFSVNRLTSPQIFIDAQIGDITGITSDAVGFFAASLQNQANEFYHVSVSNDTHLVLCTIRDRTSEGFVLELKKLTINESGLLLTPYDPSSLCTVTVTASE